MISSKGISVFLLLCCVVGIGRSCKVDEDCDMENTMCRRSQCTCQKGFVMNSDMTSCMQVADGYGGECEDSVQCSAVLQSGGQCTNHTCVCAAGYHYLKGRCWKTSKLGQFCGRNENCYVNYDFESGVCNKRVCECAQGYYQREYSSCRKISSGAGEPCLITPDCQYSGGACLKNRTCGYGSGEEGEMEGTEMPHHHPALDQPKKLGGKCNSNGDCGGVKYSQCGAGKLCSCQPGYYNYNNVTCSPEIGSYCSSESDCMGDYMTCRTGKNWCTCKDGYVPTVDNQRCSKMARDIGWSCLSDRWCSTFGPGGECSDKKCTCSNTTHYVPSQYFCWVTKKVGEKCKSVEDCGGDIKSESCVNGKCKCMKGYHPSTNGTVCRPDGNSVGDPCYEDLDCLLTHSQCNTTGHSCVCSPGYMKLGDSCVPGVGGTCEDSSSCKAEGSFCNETLCSCDDSHISSLDYSACLQIADDFGFECTESQQCTPLLGEGGTCDGNCTCSQGYHNVGAECYQDVQLYQPCASSPQCLVGTEFAECRNDICQCMRGHPPDAFNATCTDDGSLTKSSQLFLIVSLLLAAITR